MANARLTRAKLRGAPDGKRKKRKLHTKTATVYARLDAVENRLWPPNERVESDSGDLELLVEMKFSVRASEALKLASFFGEWMELGLSVAKIEEEKK